MIVIQVRCFMIYTVYVERYSLKEITVMNVISPCIILELLVIPQSLFGRVKCITSIIYHCL